MENIELNREENEIILERYVLAMERLEQIPMEDTVLEPFRSYFHKTANFLLLIRKLYENIENNGFKDASLEVLEDWNDKLYSDLRDENYAHSYANPTYAVQVLGEEYGRLLSFLYAQMRSTIGYAYEQKRIFLTIYAELFIEVYNLFEEASVYGLVHEAVYYFMSDYCDLFMHEKIYNLVSKEASCYRDIIMNADLKDLRYLYSYGLHVTENERKLASYLNSLSEERIQGIARTFVDGYHRGYVLGNKDIRKKDSFDLRFSLGLERIVRASIPMLQEIGLTPIFSRNTISTTPANKQYAYDHRFDQALYLDKQYKERNIQELRLACEVFKEEAKKHGGPILLETFGEKPFAPENKVEAYRLGEKQQKLSVELSSETTAILYEYIPHDESSFCIIAFPNPEIGDNFEEIFDETMRVNTLDYTRYEIIQQTIIDALDAGEYVRVKGTNGNVTDLKICLHPLKDPSKQTNFENCLADVNIPLGEVFTSPKLTGTEGVLHVSRVFLKGLEYKDLKITLKDGMICDYSCKNFEDEAANKAYLKENLLYNHDTIPIGEFAIGTNTTAYAMAKKFNIFATLPILIAEKTGPHFAMGDTCYSYSEDIAVFNPNGKEIVARDNECSIVRKTRPDKAYFSCHTDITIPYDELGEITSVDSDGNEVTIIKDCRFVLKGTEELNEALDNGNKISD